MADQINPTAGAKQAPVYQKDEPTHKPVTGKDAAHADRVSLGADAAVDKTYGPGLKVGSPYQLLRDLVIKTFREQGVNLQISTGEQTVDLERMTPEEAQALVAEDGYFGVEKTSQRIVDFAIDAFARDPAKLEQMKAAIDQGFREAQKAFGGALPEISQQTYDAIMEKLDAFAGHSEETQG
jgi:hypothetical protein